MLEANIKGLDRTHLNLCRVFYLKYPQICATVSRKLQGMGEISFLPAEITSDGTENLGGKISATASHKFETPPETLISSKKMVEYALSGMDNNLFVSQYMLQLPDKKELEKFLINQMNELGME